MALWKSYGEHEAIEVGVAVSADQNRSQLLRAVVDLPDVQVACEHPRVDAYWATALPPSLARFA